MSQIVNKLNETIISAQSMGADVTSSQKFVGNCTQFSAQFVWSGGGSPVGTVYIQASNDPLLLADPTSSSATWDNLSNSAVSGNSGSVTFNVTEAGFIFFRVFYDRTSGTATANCYFSTKGSG